jgi:hypothetical protein
MFADAPIRWTDPSTWPWMFYVWAAFALTGLAKPAWSWFRRQRAGGWPVADGHIESVEVSKPSFSFTTKHGDYVAELGYSYSIAGTSHSGRYKREFPTEYEAEEFVRDLKGKPVAVHCNSTSPSNSALLEPDIDVLLQNRAPAPAADFPSAANSVPDWIRPFIWVFVWLAAVGLVVSLWVHIGALTGRSVSSAFWVLHVGIFLVWFPSVLIAQKLVGNASRKDFWKVMLKGAPDWMRYMVYVFSAYEFVNFMISMSQASGGVRHTTASAADWRGFSGLWMVFYSAALAILYSAARMMESSPRCASGHLAAPNARYCTRCGQPVMRGRYD